MSSMKKFISILLVMVLMIGVIPPMNLLAAGTPTIEIIGLYTPDADEYVDDDISKEPENLGLITRMTTRSITLKGNYYNFDPVQVEKFYYTVTSVKPDGTKTTVVYDKNIPYITGDTSFEFRNVILTEGLNKIVIYSVNATTSSKAAWVYYYPVTTITDLKVNEEIFKDGMIIPQDPLNNGTTLVITGTAPNAESVVIQKMGDATPYSGYYNSQTGYFQFKVDSVNSTKLADIKLDGGDQQFEIIANNDTQKMTLKRTFVYNDGTPFIFENKIANMNGGSPETLYNLVTQPVIDGVSNEVYLEGNIKVDVDPVSGLLIYEDAIITIPRSAGSDEVTFHLDTKTYALDGNVNLDASITEDTARSTSYYKVFNYSISNIQINTGSRKQSIITEFRNAMGTVTKPTYNFDYINTSLPYISEVKFADTNISLIDGTQVNELPIRLKFYHNSSSTDFSGINIYYDGNKLLPYVNQIAYDEYEITWLPEGIHNLNFIPKDGSGDRKSVV